MCGVVANIQGYNLQGSAVVTNIAAQGAAKGGNPLGIPHYTHQCKLRMNLFKRKWSNLELADK
jgi:hypothetical protein